MATRKKPQAKRPDPATNALAAEHITAKCQYLFISGWNYGEIAEELGLKMAEVRERLDAALETLSDDNRRLAGYQLTVRLARLDRIIAAFSDDLDSKVAADRRLAAHEIRETEKTRELLLRGDKEIAKLDRELRTPLPGDPTNDPKPSTSITFTRRGNERAEHVEPRDAGDADA